MPGRNLQSVVMIPVAREMIYSAIHDPVPREIRH